MQRSFSRFMLLNASAVLLTPFMLAGTAQAQSTDDVEANASVTIIAPISVTKGTDLDFGTIAKGTSGTSTVSIAAANGTRSVTGDAGAAPGTSSRATFSVTGEDDATFAINFGADVTDSKIELAHSGSGDPLEVTLALSANSGTLTEGSASFGVGGSFSLDGTTATGAYTGSFTVEVAYN